MSTRHATSLAARTMVRLGAPWVGTLLLLTAVGYTVALVVLASVADPDPKWATSAWVSHWVALVGGFGIGTAVPVFIAHGLTRRTSLIAGALVAAAMAAGMALFLQVGLIIEWAVFRAFGQSYQVDSAHMFDSVFQVHLVLAEYGLQFAGFLLTGLLISVCYQRAGAWWGTLAVPLALVPAVLTLFALSMAWRGGSGDDLPWVASLSNPAATALAVAVLAVGLGAARLLTRTLPVQRR